MAHQEIEEDTAFHSFLPMILEDPSTHGQFIKQVEETRLRALEILQDPEFSQRAFFDKFQESFSIHGRSSRKQLNLESFNQEIETNPWNYDAHPDFNILFKVISAP